MTCCVRITGNWFTYHHLRPPPPQSPLTTWALLLWYKSSENVFLPQTTEESKRRFCSPHVWANHSSFWPWWGLFIELLFTHLDVFVIVFIIFEMCERQVSSGCFSLWSASLRQQAPWRDDGWKPHCRLISEAILSPICPFARPLFMLSASLSLSRSLYLSFPFLR